MKNLLLFVLSMGLVGCAVVNNISYKRNPNCTGIKEVKVFQVLNNGALATTSAADSIVVYLPSSDKYSLFDGVKIQRQFGECIVYDGVYKYTTSGSDNGVIKYSDAKNQKETIEYSSNTREKTVPVVKFEKRWLDY